MHEFSCIVDNTLSEQYDALLTRLRENLGNVATKSKVTRLEIPEPSVYWLGNKSVFRNFSDFPKILRRDAGHLLMFLAKELATAASQDGDRAIFIGRKDPQSFSVLINRYMTRYVICPVCGSPDTHPDKERRVQILVCEACGARSPTGQG